MREAKLAAHQQLTMSPQKSQLKVRLAVFMKSQHDKAHTETTPMFKWSLCVRAQTNGGTYSEYVPILDEVTFNLHATFDEPQRVVTRSPFRVEEQGWGEFDIPVVLRFKSGSQIETSTIQVPLRFPHADNKKDLVEMTEHTVDFHGASEDFARLVEITNNGTVERDRGKKRKRDHEEDTGSHRREKKKKIKKEGEDDISRSKSDTKRSTADLFFDGADGGNKGANIIDWEAIQDHILVALAKYDDNESGAWESGGGLKHSTLRTSICDKVLGRDMKKHEKSTFKLNVNRVVEDYDAANGKPENKDESELMALANAIEQSTERDALSRIATLVGDKGSFAGDHFQFDIFSLHAGIIQRIRTILGVKLSP